MENRSANIKDFIDYEWREIENHTAVKAYRDPNVQTVDTPTLIVGIGGTGVNAAKTFKSKLEQNYSLTQKSCPEFLFIDTDPASAVGEDGSDVLIIQSADTAVMLRKIGNGDDMLPYEISNWLDPELSPFRVMNGAAGIRQAGRLILFLNLSKVVRVLKRKLNKISHNYDFQTTRAKVHIMMGIGGGTGSGMFVDISYLIRHLCPNCEIQSFVFMPDVSCMKKGLHDINERNIKRNAYAALQEIDHLMTLEDNGKKFEQSYLNGTIIISTKAPIFDSCVLVGSKQNGRKALSSEKQVFDHVAEYLLMELHQKEKMSFDFESFKCNVFVDMGQHSKEECFNKYAAVDAEAKYLPTNQFYSMWLADVFSLLSCSASGSLSNPSVNDFFNELRSSCKECKEKDKIDKIPIGPKARANKINGIKSLMNDTETGLTMPPCSAESKIILLRDDSEKIYNMCSDEILKGAKKNYDKKYKKRFAKLYIEAFEENIAYKDELNEYGKAGAMGFKEVMEAIYEKCQKYKQLSLDGTAFRFSKTAYDRICVQEKYINSCRDAASAVVDDFIKKTDIWTGKTPPDENQYLVDYIAKLLYPYFSKSGCASLNEIMEYATSSGTAAVKDIFEDEILNKLEASQLWPIKAGIIADNITDFSSAKILAHSNDSHISELVEKWEDKSSDNISDLPYQLHDRIAKGVFAVGYSLAHYYNINEYKLIYEDKGNPGVNLFSGKLRDFVIPLSDKLKEV